MSITNYGELKTALTRYLKRPDLVDLYDDWVDFASSRIDNDCRLAEQEYRTIATANAEFMALPLDFIEMRNIQVKAAGGKLPLKYLTPEQLDNIGRIDKTQPVKYYTIFNSQLELVPAPASNSTLEIELFYFAKVITLANDGDTNKVLLAFPHLYLYAMMVEAMPFTENPDGVQSWNEMYGKTVEMLNRRAEKGRYSGNSLHMRAV